MSRNTRTADRPLSKTALIVLAALALAGSAPAAANLIHVAAWNFTLGTNDHLFDGGNEVRLVLDPVNFTPFSQSAVKQGSAPALLGPNPAIPYFTVRFAMPIPPENATSNVAALLGMDPAVFTHNHSPGLEILPNGDALAIYF